MADATGLRTAVQNRAGFIARRLAIDLDEDLVRTAQQHRRTGEMTNAIDVRYSRTGSTSWKVTADVPVKQAYYTDQGRGPVVAKRAKALRIVLDGNVVIFRMRAKAYAGSRWFSKVMTPQHVRSTLQRFVGR